MQSVSHNCDHAILERQKKKKNGGKIFHKTELNVLTNCLCQRCSVLKICTSLIHF